MGQTGRQFTQRLMVVLLALALGFVGFGHRMTGPVGPNLAAFAMPDGTLPELCEEGSGGNGKTDAPCPACTIASAAQLPAVVALPVVLLTMAQADWAAPVQSVAQAHHARAPPARGPPTAFQIV